MNGRIAAAPAAMPARVPGATAEDAASRFDRQQKTVHFQKKTTIMPTFERRGGRVVECT
ncbi:MAG: hypothetical protein QMC09_19315 [Thauera sp.]|nr:hypothetical protein [Thauera sp.]